MEGLSAGGNAKASGQTIRVRKASAMDLAELGEKPKWGHVKDPFAHAYLEKFAVRVKVLPEYHKRQSYSDVIREAQEALELLIKGLLRHIGHESQSTLNPI